MGSLGADNYAYKPVQNWAKLPPDLILGDVAGIAVDDRDRVYLFNRGKHPIVVLSQSGEVISTWGEGVFSNPHGASIGPDQCIYLTDNFDHTVRKFSLDGELLLKIGIAGESSGFMSGKPFCKCTHSAVSPTGDIFVSDRTFYALYDDVEGVVNGTPVTVNGFPVGSITDISFFKQNKLLVKFRVENDIKFSVNSLAQIYETGLIGGKALAIIPAMDNSRVAVSKDTLKSSVAPGLTDLVNEKLTPLQENIEMMIVSANNVLEKINSVFDDPTRSNLRTSVSDFSETISDLKETSVMIKSIVKTNKIAINNTIDNVKDLSEDLSSISNTINSSDLEKTLLNLKSSSENLSNVLENINNGDGSISKLISNDSLFTNLNNASNSIDLLLKDIRLNPKRYLHFSVFGKKNKPYISK